METWDSLSFSLSLTFLFPTLVKAFDEFARMAENRISEHKHLIVNHFYARNRREWKREIFPFDQSKLIGSKWIGGASTEYESAFACSRFPFLHRMFSRVRVRMQNLSLSLINPAFCDARAPDPRLIITHIFHFAPQSTDLSAHENPALNPLEDDMINYQL